MSITYTIDRARRMLFTVAEGSVTFSDITGSFGDGAE